VRTPYRNGKFRTSDIPPLLVLQARSQDCQNEEAVRLSAVSSPIGVWGGASAEIDFGAF